MPSIARTLPAVLSAFALGVAGCGDDGDEGGAGREGGQIEAALTSFPETLDPATDYTSEGWTLMWPVYAPPVTYRRAEGAEGAELIPALAEEMPTVSEDGLTYRFTFREGLEYSDGTPLRASDFEHTIKRVLALDSGGTGFFIGVVGAEDYLEAGDNDADIEGIETDNQTREVTIRLEEPDAAFLNVLAMSFAGVVPGDTPFENQTGNPPPGIGQFKITRSVPGREVVLERNEAFPEIEGLPEAKLDQINVRVMKDQRRQTQNVIDGELDWMFDPPPTDLLPEVRERYDDRFEEQVTGAVYYFWLNTAEPPFDDPEVRRAVHIGLDKAAIARLYGGLMQPHCNFLPPGMPGFEELDPCPFGDPEAGGDKERAREMLEEAGVTGTEITVWGVEGEPTDNVVQNYAEQLNEMGFEAKPRLLNGSVYFETIGNTNTPNLHTGFTNWFQDFPHPANFFFLVHGDTIKEVENENLSQTDIPEVNRGIDRLSQEPNIEEVVEEWAELDRIVTEHSGLIPFGVRELTTFMSERMDFEDCSLYHPLYGDDLTSFCLKE